MICLNPEAMPYFEGFTQGAGKRYIKIQVDSVYRLKHKYAWDWYRLLLNNSEDNGVWTNVKFSTSFLKKWLGLGINAYMRPKEQGGFDATHFRQYCIQAPLEEVAAGEQIKIYPHGEKGKLYYKDKAGPDNGDKVLGYYVDYVVYDNNRTKKLTKKRKSSSEHAESD